MKLGRVVVLTIAVVAIVLLGGTGVGLVIARTVLASEPTDEHPATSTPTATVTPAQPRLPDPPDKSQPADAPVKRSTIATRSQAPAQDQGAVYSWEDGDRTLKVVLQNDLFLQNTLDNTPDDEVVAKGSTHSIVRKRAKHGQDACPVFRSELGGGLMTLPGGVLLALDPAWDQGTVERFFYHNDIQADSRSELGFIQNGFLVKTEPGFPSLELANALAAQDGVVISSPNWWREVEAK